jgi:gliding motility-associated-like protein
MGRLLAPLFFFLAFAGNHSYAQQIFCPYNLDFEQGNLGGWQFDTGSCCPISITMPGPGAIFNRHTLMSGAALDSFGKFPVVAPGGGNFSLKLGNHDPGSDAERARYFIQVPNGPSKYIFIYRYAVVFQDGGHDAVEQPRFTVRAFDSITNSTIVCNEHNYVVNANIPGFQLSLVPPGDAYFKPWTSATLDLSAYAGKTVGIDFISGDCAVGGHFGYGYVDMNCGLFQIWATKCNNSPNVILKGPPGYQSYQWMDGNFITPLGTTQDITIPAPSTGTYFAVIATPYPGFGCTDTFFTEYTVKIDYIAAVAPDVNYCANSKAQLSVSTANPNGPFLYNWWPATDLSCTACSNPVTAPGTKTTYHVWIENKYGCKDTADVVVDVLPVPQANAGPDTTACPGNVIQLSGNGGITYKWLPAYGLDNPNSQTPNATVLTPLIYQLVVTNSDNCRDTDEVKITPYPKPTANAGADSVVCYGAIVKLQGTGGGIYKWYPDTGLTNPNIANPLALLGDTIEYSLVVTNSYGCHDTDGITFHTFFPEPLDAGPDSSICNADTVYLYAKGGQVYYWLSDYAISDQSVDKPYAWPGGNYTYLVRIKDTLCNRLDTVEAVIKAHPLGQLRAVATPIKCGGEGIGQLTAYGGKGYQWIPSDYLDNPTGAITKANPRTTTAYTLIGINGYGCDDTASAVLEVHGDDGVFVPSAFTPNGDGRNDCLGLIVTGDIRSFEWHIFNRWGQPVFETTNLNGCWDGTFKGEPQDLGTFYYFFRATTPLCGEIIRKGEVQLIR